jgi:hypothetical protein
MSAEAVRASEDGGGEIKVGEVFDSFVIAPLK